MDSPVRVLFTTVKSALPLPLPEDALIVACPGEIAVTTPAPSTDATWGLLDVQRRTAALRGFPSEPRAVAESRVFAPITSGVFSGSISMRVTGPTLTI